jgi:hypothetical protein
MEAEFGDAPGMNVYDGYHLVLLVLYASGPGLTDLIVSHLKALFESAAWNIVDSMLMICWEWCYAS